MEHGETPMYATKRDLYEETGMQDCRMISLGDYEYIYKDRQGRNNERDFFCGGPMRCC